MKRRMTALLTALLLVLALCVPVMAETDYGLIYDETEMLGDLSYLGEEMLPELSEELGVDLRVDVFTDEGVENSSVSDIAVYVYENSGYGCGEKRDGVSLTLLLRGTEDGAYTLSETDWCVYALLDAARGSAQELSDVVRDAVSPYMAQRPCGRARRGHDHECHCALAGGGRHGGERGGLPPGRRLAGRHRR